MTSLTVAAQSWHGRISLRLFDRDMGTASASYQWDNATREPPHEVVMPPSPGSALLARGRRALGAVAASIGCLPRPASISRRNTSGRLGAPGRVSVLAPTRSDSGGAKKGVKPMAFALARASAATMAPGQPLGCLAGFGASLGLGARRSFRLFHRVRLS